MASQPVGESQGSKPRATPREGLVDPLFPQAEPTPWESP